MVQYYKGRFTPKNPSKYRGDPTNIIYRSRWELICMRQLDANPNILEWGSEEVVVWYESPLDGQPHRYFVDFYIKARNKNGEIIERLIEIKPEKETKPPEVQTKKSKKYITEVAKWGVNSAKWEAARKYADQRGWQFVILTERHLFKQPDKGINRRALTEK